MSLVLHNRRTDLRLNPDPQSYRAAPGELFLLSTSDPRHKIIKDMFYDGWEHPDKSCSVKSVYVLSHSHVEWLKRTLYATKHLRGDTELLFHGTTRACMIGESTGMPCQDPRCSICCILKSSFKLSHSSPAGMFGRGIYSTPCSSKADSYARNIFVRSRLHAVLICAVACNRKQPIYFDCQHRTGPDHPFDSVSAVTRDKGGSVNYPEVVVYEEGAIIPLGVVMYTRSGWVP